MLYGLLQASYQHISSEPYLLKHTDSRTVHRLIALFSLSVLLGPYNTDTSADARK